jgi:hypothetical protein
MERLAFALEVTAAAWLLVAIPPETDPAPDGAAAAPPRWANTDCCVAATTVPSIIIEMKAFIGRVLAH